VIKSYLTLLQSPVQSILDNIGLKALFAVVIAPFTSFLPEMNGHAILNLPPTLLVIVGCLWLLDLLSGLVKTVRTGGFKEISSIGIRMTVIKFIEYAIFLLAVDLFSSTAQFAGWADGIIAKVDEVGAIILAATELLSIDENLQTEWLEKMGRVVDFPEWLTGTEEVAESSNSCQ